MELTYDLFDAVEKYFSLIRRTGYKMYDEVDKLLVFMFIEEILYGRMSQYVNDSDYRMISNALDCMYGNCIIPFPDYKRGIDNIYDDLYDQYRITESSILRNTEFEDLRTEA